MVPPSSRWLADAGYEPPREERFPIGVHYTTRLFQRRPADLGGCRHVVSSVPPDGRRGGWTLATSADLGHPEVDGRRTPGWRLIDSYVGRLFKVAHRDAAVANAYLRVVSMTSAPSSLFHRRIAWRVLTGITTGGEPDPEPSPRAPAGRRATA